MYIEKWLALEYQHIKPSIMLKNTLNEMQKYIAINKKPDTDWEKLYSDLRTKFVVPRLLDELTKTQSLPLTTPGIKLPFLDTSNYKSNSERTRIRHDFYMEVGEAFTPEKVSKLPDRLKQLISVDHAYNLSQIGKKDFRTLTDPISDEEHKHIQAELDKAIDAHETKMKKP